MEDGLILEADDGLCFFRTASDLESYVEAIDVENGEYKNCWDSQGNLYHLRVGSSSLVGRLLASNDVVHPRTG